MYQSNPVAFLLPRSAVQAAGVNYRFGDRPADGSPEGFARECGAACAAMAVLETCDVEQIAAWSIADIDTMSGDEDYFTDASRKVYGAQLADDRRGDFRDAYEETLRAAILAAREALEAEDALAPQSMTPAPAPTRGRRFCFESEDTTMVKKEKSETARAPGAWRSGTPEAERRARGLPRTVGIRLSVRALAILDRLQATTGRSRSGLIEDLVLAQGES